MLKRICPKFEHTALRSGAQALCERVSDLSLPRTNESATNRHLRIGFPWAVSGARFSGTKLLYLVLSSFLAESGTAVSASPSTLTSLASVAFSSNTSALKDQAEVGPRLPT